MKRYSAHRSRGTVYVLVLGVTMIVTVTGMGALMANRVYQRRVGDLAAAAAARAAAESAVDVAMFRIANNASWRTTYTSGVWTAASTLGSGTCSFKIVDELDGNLSTGGAQPVRIYGRGVVGDAVRIYSVEMVPANAVGPSMVRVSATWRRETLP